MKMFAELPPELHKQQGLSTAETFRTVLGNNLENFMETIDDCTTLFIL